MIQSIYYTAQEPHGITAAVQDEVRRSVPNALPLFVLKVGNVVPVFVTILLNFPLNTIDFRYKSHQMEELLHSNICNQASFT